MFKKYHLFFAIVGVILTVFMVWYFSNIVAYVLISAVLSIIGQPLVRRLHKIKIRKFSLPKSVCALITLITIILLFVGFVWFFVPLISSQANVISNINVNNVLAHFEGTIASIQSLLVEYDIFEQGQTIDVFLAAQMESLVNIATFQVLFTNVLSTTGSFLMAVFSILFITFFFLKDEHMLSTFILLLVPEKHEEQTKNVLAQTKFLLTRYFIGLIGEIVSMMTLLTIGLTILGVKNALIIGFLGGLMNVIPYLGPLIGATMGVVFGVTSNLGLGMYDQIGIVTLGIIGTFAVANLFDNIILQPFIYSNSVKARPIEIFIVIIMAGTIAGIPGMILAIPAYTVIRILAKEFLNQLRLVKKLTEKM